MGQRYLEQEIILNYYHKKMVENQNVEKENLDQKIDFFTKK